MNKQTLPILADDDSAGNPDFMSMDTFLQSVPQDDKNSETGEFEAILLSMIENSPEGIFSIDRNYKILYANNRVIENVYRITGIRVKPGDEFPEWKENVHVTREWKGYLAKALSGEKFKVGTTLIMNSRPVYREVQFGPVKKADEISGAVCFIKEVNNNTPEGGNFSGSDVRFRSLIDNSQQCVALLGIDGRFKSVTPSIERILGYSHEALIGKDPGMFTHPDDRGAISGLIDQLFPRYGRTVQAVYRMKNRDESWRWVRSNITNLLHEPAIEAIVFNYEDVTDSKNAEEIVKKTNKQLREAADRQSSILDSLDAHIALLNKDGVIIAVNEAWKKFAVKNDYSHPEYGLGVNYFEVTGQSEGLEGTDMAIIGKGIKNVLDGKRSRFTMEYSCNSPCDRQWFNVVVTPLSKKYKSGAVVAHFNITAQKAAELQIQHERKNLNALINSTGDMMWSIDENKRLKTGNQAFLDRIKKVAGVDLKTGDEVLLTGKYPQETLKTWEQGYNTVLAGSSFMKEIYSEKTDTWSEVSFNPVMEQGRVIGVACYSRDITERRLSDQLIRQRERMMAEAESIAHIGSWEVGLLENQRDHQQLQWSDEAFRIFGFDPGQIEISNENFFRAVHPEDRESVLQHVKSAIKSNSGYNQEYRIVKPDGSVRWVHVQAKIITDPNTSVPIKLVGTVLDITDRKEANYKLKQAEITYREIFDKASDAIFVMDPDTGIVLDVNLKACEITGFTKNEMLNSTPEDLISGSRKMTLEEAKAQLKKAVSTGSLLFEWQAHRKDGSLFWTEVNLVKATIAGEERILAFFREIDDRKQAEEQLLKSEERYRQMVETMLEGICMVDHQNLITYVNRRFCEMLEYEAEEMIGRPFFQFLSEEGQKFAREARERRVKGARENTVIQYLGKSGRVIWAHISVTPLFNEEKQYAGALSMVTDITNRKLAEEAVVLSNERYKLATKATNDAIWDWYIQTDELFWSEAYESMFGYKENSNESNIEAWKERIHPDDKERVLSSIYAELMSPSSHSWQCEYRYFRVDGTIAHVFDRGYILYDENRNPLRMVGAMQDISDRKLTEEALKKKTYDINERVKELNALYRISLILHNSALSTQEVLKRCVNIIASAYQYPDITCVRITLDNMAFTSENFIETRWKQEAKIFIQNQQAGSIEVFYLEEMPEAYEGPFLKEEMSLINSIARNITISLEHRRAEESLFKSETNLRTIFDHTDNAYLLLDTAYNLLSFNVVAGKWAMQVFGFKLEEGISLLSMLPEQLHAETRNNFSDVLAGKSKESETSLPAGNGTVLWFYSRISPVFNAEGQVAGISIASKDITDRKNHELEREKMTAEIIQRNKDLEQFAYIVSHNLRAPVANIIGFNDVLQDGDLNADETKQIMNGLAVSVNRLDNVIVDLNEILKVRRDLNEHRESVDFAELVQTIEGSIQDQIVRHQVSIVCDFQEKNMSVFKSYLYSIFYNLITNSIKYRQPGQPPVIEIQSKKVQDKITISFRDNGLGIDLEKRGSQVFGLYKRFHQQVADGKGLGLFMVKKQVEALGGKIDVRSQINNGTVFTIEFEKPKN